MRNVLILLAIALFSFDVFTQNATQGTLYAVSKKGTELGACPLKDTKVTASISGFIARVNVRQEFTNSFTEPIEAIYTFPLSQNGAVDDMTMTVGTRTIRGKIMKREEAREVYEAAKTEGKTASLLDQERPNIFTQAVANIMPGESVTIEISYVEMLKYEDGQYEFVFPMTVGPRYTPASVADANKVKPPIAKERAGHDISIEVNLNAGVPVEAIHSTSHEIQQINISSAAAKVTLADEKTIPNKDFVLRYDVSGKRIADGLLTHRGEKGGFFTLILQPPDFPVTEDRTPKEIVFVLDTSGSMYGFPIEKAKEAMRLSLDGLYPEDTFNLITFAGDTRVLFDKPVTATQGNLERAKAFLDSHYGGGGTEMMKAIKASLEPSASQEHLRIVCFMTDGYVGNESEIIAEIQRHPKARVFSFGIGSSVNRFLLDKMAEAGNGEVEYVSLDDDGSKAARKFHERVRTPLLTDISIEWSGMPVADVYPAKIGDLFSAKPVVINGRYTKGAGGTIKLKGKVAGQEYVREISVNFPETETANDVLATLWARKRIDQLSSEALNSKAQDEVNKQITDLALDFRLMTSFTSFVAVEERLANPSGSPVRVEVPIEIPEGVDRMMVTGAKDKGKKELGEAYKKWLSSDVAYIMTAPEAQAVVDVTTSSTGSKRRSVRPARMANQPANVSGLTLSSPTVAYGSGTGSGTGYGGLTVQSRQVSSGILNGKATSLPKPPYPTVARAAKASGAVTVQVTIDESGNIVSASAVSGHPLLRAAAEKAAERAKFTPTMLSGQPVKVTGVITYNFVDPNGAGNIQISPGELSPDAFEPATAEMLREQMIGSKLHAWVYSLFERIRKGSSEPGPNEALFVKDGLAELKIEVSERTVSVLEKLKAIGFAVISDGGDGKTVTGKISPEKIGALAEIDEVKLVLPRVN